MKYIEEKELVDSKEFIEEPVKKIIEEIDNSSNQKIAIYGTSGCGKTSVLLYDENKKINSDTKAIYTKFSSMKMFGNGNEEEIFNLDFINHYYELIISNKILNYLKQYHNDIYRKEFVDLASKIEQILLSTNEYITYAHFGKRELENKLEFGEITSELLKKMKRELGATSIYLLVDRFDWIDNKSRLSQEILRKYFELFDKVVLSIDDENIQEEKGQIPFKEKGYSFIKVDYGKEKEILKQIIYSRVKLYNSNLKETEKMFPISLLTDKIYNSIIQETNGNITMALTTLEGINKTHQLMNEDFDIEDRVKYYCDAQKELEGFAKKISYPPTFYL